jgi:hypothetical protein
MYDVLPRFADVPPGGELRVRSRAAAPSPIDGRTRRGGPAQEDFMAFRPSAPHKRSRWLVLLAVLAISTTVLAATALAAPVFTFQSDDQGPNDEPGQKDLTAQSSAFDAGTGDFYTAWKWDDTSWSGKNTGDGCSLFNTGGNAFNVDYAVCATIGGKSPTLLSVTVYSCSDGRADRCTNPVLLDTSTNYCEITNQVASGFPSATDKDTQSTCNISAIDDALSSVTGLDNSTLLNTCSYPSREPNSDPSDCVITIANVNTSVATAPSGTTTWSATLVDTATLSPTTATGSVVFKLWGVNTAGVCSSLIWESTAVSLGAGATASTVGAGTALTSPNPDTIVTQATVDADGVYYWTVDYTPTGAFNSSTSPCGETTTITPASVAPAATP